VLLYNYRKEKEDSKMIKNWLAIVNLMDDDIRERVAFELAPCTEEAFLKRYLELDPDFQNVLDTEF
jgi:hypothetical protein